MIAPAVSLIGDILPRLGLFGRAGNDFVFRHALDVWLPEEMFILMVLVG